MNQGTSSLDVIRNNAATFGNVLGAEYMFWDRGENAKVVDDENFFYDKNQINLQELTFKDIEKTPLGKLIKSQCSRLEQKVKGFQSKISNIHASWKDKELELRLNAEAGLQKQFEFKMVRAVEMFREEVTALKGQHK